MKKEDGGNWVVGCFGAVGLVCMGACLVHLAGSLFEVYLPSKNAAYQAATAWGVSGILFMGVTVIYAIGGRLKNMLGVLKEVVVHLETLHGTVSRQGRNT